MHTITMAAVTEAQQTSLKRLQQTLSHVQYSSIQRQPERKLAIVQGNTQQQLWDMTLGELLAFQRLRYPDNEVIVCPWTGARWTYSELDDQATQLARGLLAKGIKHGDRIGVMAGNCEQYAAVIFAAARVGAILVVINNTYTHAELMYALEYTGMLWTTVEERAGETYMSKIAD